jgi:hypothetical protein
VPYSLERSFSTIEVKQWLNSFAISWGSVNVVEFRQVLSLYFDFIPINDKQHFTCLLQSLTLSLSLSHVFSRT